MHYHIRKLIQVGRLLFEEGLVDARAGNLSVRIGQKMLITRRGSHLGTLKEHDFILLDITKTSILDSRASSELLVHREVYIKTQNLALVHAHPTAVIKLSFRTKKIVPKDGEGKTLLKSVKVIPNLPSGSQKLAEAISDILSQDKLVVVRSHGVFSADTDPFYAYSHISVLEHSCKILLDD
jgi:L-fuculose-phosphate aldolase